MSAYCNSKTRPRMSRPRSRANAPRLKTTARPHGRGRMSDDQEQGPDPNSVLRLRQLLVRLRCADMSTLTPLLEGGHREIGENDSQPTSRLRGGGKTKIEVVAALGDPALTVPL